MWQAVTWPCGFDSLRDVEDLGHLVPLFSLNTHGPHGITRCREVSLKEVKKCSFGGKSGKESQRAV